MNFSRNLKTFNTVTAAALAAALVVLVSACSEGQRRVSETPQKQEAQEARDAQNAQNAIELRTVAETQTTAEQRNEGDAAVSGQRPQAPAQAAMSRDETSQVRSKQRNASQFSTLTQSSSAEMSIAPADANTAAAGPARSSDYRYDDYHDHYQVTVDPDRENYQEIISNPIKRVVEEPVSTFSVDVDTGAYANVRRFLQNGHLPQADAVRTEELINYFDYDYEAPTSDEAPFSINTLLMPSPWNESTSLLQIGLRGYDVDSKELPNSNLVFLIDVSGSMNRANKLPLLKRSMQLLTAKMREDDRIAVVVYAGDSGVALESTRGDQKTKINNSIKTLRAGGSTHGSAGISLAYEIAADNFIDGGINRVILATDGDFNVGTVDVTDLIKMIEQRRDSGISLTTLGFGVGNLNDHLMEQLADSGNGNYAYIDTLSEANKVLVEEMSSTLHTIASDVKIQIEFNPALVAEYRLIGYENRSLKREDFNNDRIDAGEIGAGHTVTALYEIALVGSGGERIEPLRYTKEQPKKQAADAQTASVENEVAHIRLRYKQPGGNRSKRIERNVFMADRVEQLDDVNDDARFSAAVAAFAQKLRGGEFLGEFDYEGIRKLAKDSRGDDDFGYRAEFLKLVSLAQSLQPLKVSINENLKR